MTWVNEGHKFLSEIKVDDRVRIVEIRGCMGTIRHNPREGTVIRIEKKVMPFGTSKIRTAIIMLDNGQIIKRITENHLWWVYDGMPEYYE